MLNKTNKEELNIFNMQRNPEGMDYLKENNEFIEENINEIIMIDYLNLVDHKIILMNIENQF